MKGRGQERIEREGGRQGGAYRLGFSQKGQSLLFLEAKAAGDSPCEEVRQETKLAGDDGQRDTDHDRDTGRAPRYQEWKADRRDEEVREAFQGEGGLPPFSFSLGGADRRTSANTLAFPFLASWLPERCLFLF